jgi:hypothetical protein
MAKQIKTLEDAQKAINELYNRLELQRTKDWDFTGLKIKNAGDGVDPTDYVTLQQLPSLKNQEVIDNDYYTIVFSKDGIVTTGEESPGFIIGNGREGVPTQVWVVCEPGNEPSGGPLTINVSWTYIDAITGLDVTTNLLSVDLSLPSATSQRVFSSNFISPAPRLGNGAKINKVIVAGNNAGYVSVGLVVKVKVKNQ